MPRRPPLRRPRTAALLVALATFAVTPALTVGVAWAQPAADAAALPPAPSDGVHDGTGSLDADLRRQIAGLVAATRQQADVRLAVALVPDTGGRSIDAYGDDLFRAWRMGDARGRGVLLVVAVQARTNRLVVGGGLRDRIGDDVALRILTDVFRPAARAAGPGEATLRTVIAVRARLTRAVAPPAERGGDLEGAHVYVGLLALFALHFAAARVKRAREDRRQRTENILRALRGAEGDVDRDEAACVQLAARCAPLEAVRAQTVARFADLRAQLLDAAPTLGAAAFESVGAHAVIAGVRAESARLLDASERIAREFEGLRERLGRAQAAAATLPAALGGAAQSLTAIAARWPAVDVGGLRTALAEVEEDAAALPRESAALTARFAAVASREAMRALGEEVTAVERRVARVQGAAAAVDARLDELTRAERNAPALLGKLRKGLARATEAAPGAPPSERAARFTAAFTEASKLHGLGDPAAFYAALLAAQEILDPTPAPRPQERYVSSDGQVATEGSSGGGSSYGSDGGSEGSSSGGSSYGSDGESSYDSDGGSSYGSDSGSGGASGGASSDW